jgi:hypothetical protein
MVDIADAVLSAALVLLGFLLAIAWDWGRRRRDEKADRKRMLKMIKLEFDANLSVCAWLEGVQKQGITPTALSSTSYESRTVVMMNWFLLRLDYDTSDLLNQAYALADQLALLINARNQYTTLMMAMANYAQTLASMDQQIFLVAKLYIQNYAILEPKLANMIDEEPMAQEIVQPKNSPSGGLSSKVAQRGKLANLLLSPFTALVLLVASLEGESFLNQSWNFYLTQFLALLTVVSISFEIRRRIPLRITGTARIVAAFVGLILLFLLVAYTLSWRLAGNAAVAFEGTSVLTLLLGVSIFVAVQRKLKEERKKTGRTTI